MINLYIKNSFKVFLVFLVTTKPINLIANPMGESNSISNVPNIIVQQIREKWFSGDIDTIGTRANYLSPNPEVVGSKSFYLSPDSSNPPHWCNVARWSYGGSGSENLRYTRDFWLSSNNEPDSLMFYQSTNNPVRPGSFEYWQIQFNNGNWDSSFDRFCFCTLQETHIGNQKIAPCKILFETIKNIDPTVDLNITTTNETGELVGNLWDKAIYQFGRRDAAGNYINATPGNVFSVGN